MVHVHAVFIKISCILIIIINYKVKGKPEESGKQSLKVGCTKTNQDLKWQNNTGYFVLRIEPIVSSFFKYCQYLLDSSLRNALGKMEKEKQKKTTESLVWNQLPRLLTYCREQCRVARFLQKEHRVCQRHHRGWDPILVYYQATPGEHLGSS